jgi:hypothetical protein
MAKKSPKNPQLKNYHNFRLCLRGGLSIPPIRNMMGNMTRGKTDVSCADISIGERFFWRK